MSQTLGGKEEGTGRCRAGRKKQAPFQQNQPRPLESLPHLGCLARPGTVGHRGQGLKRQWDHWPPVETPEALVHP